MPDPVLSQSESELRSHVERVLSASYDLDREIGRGGMGIVYLARDKRLKRQVAIKLLPPELAFRSEIRSRFLREAETAAQLGHPNIVPIFSVDEREGLVYFVMGYIDGDNLAKRLHDQGPMDVDEARRILCETADALAYAHARGVVHRDIKPDNILLDKESGRAMVTDFGIARAVSDEGARLTATGMAIGTPAYMSPEQAAGDRDVDGRTDLYSLGIVGYQMLAGEPPFTANTPAALLVKHLTEPPPSVHDRRAGVPDDLARAVMMLLEKDPSNRFPSASSLVTALETGNVPERAGTTPSGYGAAYPLAPRRPSGGMGTVEPRAMERASAGAVAAPGEPTMEELTRWNAPLVSAFRSKLAPYLAVNAVIVPVSMFGGPDLFGVTVIWSIYLAYRYAKIWSEGYDWRDVFRQPRDRMFMDVVAEGMDEVKALWDPRKRAELRERERQRGSRSLFGRDRTPAAALPSAPPLVASGPHADMVRQAAADRDEIVRLVETMPRADRDQIPEVVPTARAIFDKMQLLVISLGELQRTEQGGSLAAVEREIADLEARANPLEAGSEERVRRLATLKRQRRALADASRRKEGAAERLEHCRLALQNMRYDVLRLRTGAQSHQHVTLLAERAMSLARDVDGIVSADDEIARSARARR